jgi:RNA 2',3'-cyclic 3'-phosphodiesterase
MRLFVALGVPPDLRGSAWNALEPLRVALPDARWAPPENWHVTVKFLGDTTAEVAVETTARLEAVAEHAVPFPTNLTEVGAFPNAAAARVLWLGLDDRAGRMAELALGVDASLSGAFPPASRPFTPHMTVARIHPASRLPASFADAAVPGAPFTVGEIVLFRSHPGRPAPRYEALARLPLRG